ncbi:MAG: transporter substrate-binding domain-containing protein [Desulfosarcina sp.]|nr:transporter substrate-binding domain-containing protein [Desulfosarcina sp.]
MVGTFEAPPFSFKTNEGRWTGISIELWENIVNEMGLKYEYKERIIKDILDDVTDESLDAVVTALTLTPTVKNYLILPIHFSIQAWVLLSRQKKAAFGRLYLKGFCRPNSCGS